MSDRELRDELMTLLVAGHETSATAVSWAMERLVRHPEALARLREDGEEYADAVIKETLRLRPVLPVVVRRVKEPIEIGGRLLPASRATSAASKAFCSRIAQSKCSLRSWRMKLQRSPG